MFRTVVDGVGIHLCCRRPGGAKILGRGTENIDFAVAIIGPGDVEASALPPAARIDGNLRESIGASHGVDGKHGGSRINDVAGGGKGEAPVRRNSENKMTAIAPDGVE